MITQMVPRTQGWNATVVLLRPPYSTEQRTVRVQARDADEADWQVRQFIEAEGLDLVQIKSVVRT